MVVSGVVLAALTGPQARSYSQAMWLPGGSTSLPDIALSDTASISLVFTIDIMILCSLAKGG